MIPQETVEHLEVIMWAGLIAAAVGAVVIPVVAALAYFLMREPGHEAAEIPTVVPKAAMAPVREEVPADLRVAAMG